MEGGEEWEIEARRREGERDDAEIWLLRREGECRSEVDELSDISSGPATSANSGGTRHKGQSAGETQGGKRYHTRVALPQIPDNFNIRRDLLLGTVNAVLLEIVDEILVAPAGATTAKIGPGGIPILAQTLEEDILSVLGPDL